MMKHYLYKMEFLTPVRFGGDRAGAVLAQSRMACHADTLFSAICQEWINVYGVQGCGELIEAAQSGLFLLSDLFPWSGQELYLPKPAIPPYIKQDGEEEGKTDKKSLKKLDYIPASKFRAYLGFLRRGGELPWLQEQESFAYETLLYRAKTAREEETMPYPVSAYCFRKNSGLYFILGVSEEWRVRLDKVMESLGLSGIGGKKSSGLGKFVLVKDSFETGLYDSDCILDELLTEEVGLYMSLSVLAPAKDELSIVKQDNSYYTLVGRTGFVASQTYAAAQLKRKPVVMFAAGACFPERIKGQVLDVSDRGGHPVYRYGKGMYLGVKI
ncbi:MAG: type III-A CRISPR-associated RAMP protein Csm4 [Peptococcaceae bacterium]|jgi:CRISPR-associated protein Csm4|nr:type III-A CRISPR-associated RAMP protein Csm4 [Peptococcaceae bacterium]MDH7524146.1 type III-A CRISPR-associated RAMP protein Csm4 [Peptococcaceae bacterium]